MANYEYIIASLPVLNQDGKSVADTSEESIAEEIRSQLSSRDTAVLDFLESGWDSGNLNSGFYSKALAHGNSFIRRYFAFDLMARNAKVEYLNKALARPEGMDIVSVEGFEPDADELDSMRSILAGDDLLQRERGIDQAYWDIIDEAVIMDVFSLSQILAFRAKLRIVERWLKLDEKTGREMFRRLVSEVRGTFTGVDYKG